MVVFLATWHSIDHFDGANSPGLKTVAGAQFEYSDLARRHDEAVFVASAVVSA
jgi:hypothetical protein